MAQSPRGARARQSLLSVMALLALACGSEGPSSPGAPDPATPIAVQVEALRIAAAASGRRVGAALQASLLRSEPEYAAAAAHHFDDVTAEYEMKWGQIERQRGVRDFAPADQIVAFASAHGMTVKGHALVWHGDSPAWLEPLSTAEVRQALRDHVAGTVRPYRGR